MATFQNVNDKSIALLRFHVDITPTLRGLA